MNTKYNIEPRKRTAGEVVKDYAVFYIWVMAIVVPVILIGKALWFPVRMLARSQARRSEDEILLARKKVARREAYRAERDSDGNDPMNQCVDRFDLYADEYAGDSDNAKYRKWLADLKSGAVRDTELRWAPDVYTSSGHRFSGEFLDYFENQAELHSAGLLSRLAFVRTVRERYPEFTPRFAALRDEIAELRARSQNADLTAELVSELAKKGVPPELAAELAGMNLGAEKLGEAMASVRTGLSRGYSQEFCLLCVRKNVDLKNPLVEAVGGDISSVYEATQDESIASVLLNQIADPGRINLPRMTVLVGGLRDSLKEARGICGDADEIREYVSESFRKAVRKSYANEISSRGGAL